MKFQRLLFVLFVLVWFATIRAQITVSYFGYSPDRFVVTETVHDESGDACMVVRVKTTDRSLFYDVAPTKIVKTEFPNSKHPNEVWVFVSPKAKYFRVMHPRLGFDPKYANDNGYVRFEESRSKGDVFDCEVLINKSQLAAADSLADSCAFFTIATDPAKATMIYDRQAPVRTPHAMPLTRGKHIVELYRKGYRLMTQVIDADSVAADSTLFFELVRNHGVVNASGSHSCSYYELFDPLYYRIGFGDLHAKPSPGTYLLKASRFWHYSDWTVVHVKDSLELNYHFNLEKIPLHVFAFGNLGKPSGLDDRAYGATVGFVRRRGLYFSMMQTSVGKADGEPVSRDLMEISADNPYLDHVRCHYRSISGGVVLRLWNPWRDRIDDRMLGLHVYAGGGYGERAFQWEGRDRLFHNYTPDDRKGALIEYGLMLNVWKVAVRGGVSRFDGVKSADFGVGIYL